jgi:hypothetical protein
VKFEGLLVKKPKSPVKKIHKADTVADSRCESEPSNDDPMISNLGNLVPGKELEKAVGAVA